MAAKRGRKARGSILKGSEEETREELERERERLVADWLEVGP